MIFGLDGAVAAPSQLRSWPGLVIPGWRRREFRHAVVKTNGAILGLANSPPILEPILVGIGMFTAGTIWILTHCQMGMGQSFNHQGPQVLVLGSIYRGKPFWGYPDFRPQAIFPGQNGPLVSWTHLARTCEKRFHIPQRRFNSVEPLTARGIRADFFAFQQSCSFQESDLTSRWGRNG